MCVIVAHAAAHDLSEGAGAQHVEHGVAVAEGVANMEDEIGGGVVVAVVAGGRGGLGEAARGHGDRQAERGVGDAVGGGELDGRLLQQARPGVPGLRHRVQHPSTRVR